MCDVDTLRIKFAGVVGRNPEAAGISRGMSARELDRALWGTASLFTRNNIHVVGALLPPQEDIGEKRTEEEREDMDLEIFPTGERINIFLPEKCERVGCRLNHMPFQQVVETVYVCLSSALEVNNTVVMLNRFGKSEAEGGGYSKVLELAMERDLPVIIGVSDSHKRRNGGHNLRGAWERYIEGTSGVVLEPKIEKILDWAVDHSVLNIKSLLINPYSTLMTNEPE